MGGVPGLIPAHNLQDEGEDVDDVSVDGEGAVDVLLGAERVLPVPQHKLGVIGKELGGERSRACQAGTRGQVPPLPGPCPTPCAHPSRQLTRVKAMAPMAAYSMWSQGTCAGKEGRRAA